MSRLELYHQLIHILYYMVLLLSSGNLTELLNQMWKLLGSSKNLSAACWDIPPLYYDGHHYSSKHYP